MNFNIDANYQRAVQEFVWPAQPGEDAHPGQIISESDSNTVTEEVANKILAASQIRHMVVQMAQRELSLLEVCMIVAQQQDSKNEITTTVSRIEQASAEEKTVIHQTVKRLTQIFEQVNAGDLKGAALLFGIHRIHQFVNEKIKEIPQQKSKLQEMEETLQKLVASRQKYENVPPEQQNFVNQMDEAILKARQAIEFLKTAPLIDKAVNQ